MKVLHVITNFAAVGGAEMMLAKLVKSRPDCEHVIVALMKTSEIYQATLHQCEYHEGLGWNGLNTLNVVAKLRHIIKQVQPDVIQGWMYHANALISLSLIGMANRPMFYWGVHHSLASPKEESLSTKIALYLSKFLSSQPDGIIYCAHSALKQHQAFGFNNKNQKVIPNGVELERFTGQRTINNPLVVGFAGRYHPAKGFEYLFETIARLKDHPVIFKVAGKSVNLENPEIRAYINKYQLDTSKIKLLDQVDDMPSFYQSIDLFLMTSITEGFPNVLVESMASGVPCVTTDVGDAGFIVEKTGEVVPPRHADALATAILHYLNLSNDQKLMSKAAARHRVEQNFSLESVSQLYFNVWNNN